MKLPRASASLLLCCTLAALAACGGGGGGAGSVTPTGGEGGAGTPPSGNPTPSTTPPATAPSTTPSPSPTPTGSPTPAAVKVSATTYYVYEDVVLGDRSWYTSGTASWSNNSGGTAAAGSGAVDGTGCTSTQEPAASTSTYSQHSFVGILYNGVLESLPQAIGMINPKPPTTPYPGNPQGHQYNTDAVEIEDCAYNVHTHDFSGLVHIEDVNQPQSNTAIMPYANLKTLFDVWGAQLTASGIVAGGSALAGPVQIYTGVPTAKYTPPNSAKSVDLVNSYSLVTGAQSTVTFGHHTAAWIVIGQLPADGLPQIAFGMEY